MPDEFYYMAIGGLGVSLAGFAGLIAALTPEQLRAHQSAGAGNPATDRLNAPKRL